MTVWDLTAFGEKTALIDDSGDHSYAELVDLGERIAGNMESRSLVFELCENSFEAIAGYLGFVNNGIVPLLLESGIATELVVDLADVYRPQFFLVPRARRDDFGEMDVLGEYGQYLLLATGYAQMSHDGLHPDLAVLVSTSGSTGTPKLVRLSYGNIRSNTHSIVSYLGINEDERAITSLPMNYVYGLSVIQTHVSVGAEIVLTNLNCYSSGFWKLYEAKQCTSFAGVPFMYEMLDKLKFTRKRRAPSMKTMTQAGGRLDPDLQDKFVSYARECGIDFFVMYGASEATARMSYLPPEVALEKRGSIGVAIPGGRFEVVDENGNALPQGEAGNLVYYGENVSLGYATCAADLAKGDENGGRLVTGDIARCDEDGFYYIVGRKKRFVKILGKRVSLDEVERLVRTEFDLEAVACGGRDDLLGIFIGDTVDEAAVSTYVHETFGINEKLFRVCRVDSIPRNTSGKVLYGELNAML